MILRITIHAQERMDAKGIEKEQVIRAIKQGATTKQADGLLARYAYLEVAYKIIGEICLIKMVKIIKN